MIGRLLKDSAVYGLAGMLVRGIQIVLIPVYTRFLSPEEYGAMDYLLVFAALANLTVALEISQGVARQFADTLEPAQRRLYASTALWFTVAAFGLFSVVALLFAAPLTQLLLDAQAWKSAFMVAVVAISVNAIFWLLQDLLRWQFKAWGYVVASAVFTLVTAGVGVYLVVVPQLGIAGIFYGQIAGATAGIAASWLFARELYGFSFIWNKCREMLRYSLPLVVSGIAVFANLYIDRIAIKELMGLSEVGLYGIGFRFASVVSLLLLGFQSALTPLIYQNHKQAETPVELARIFRYYLAAALPLILLIGLYARELLWLFTTEQYYAAWQVMPVLAAGILLANLYIFAPGLFLSKKTGHVAGINVAAALLNLALNLVLIPLLGIVGAALATTISALGAICLYMGFSQRLYPVPHDWRRIMAGCAISGIIVFASLYVPAGTTIVVEELLLKSAGFLLAAVATAGVLLEKAEVAAVLNRLRQGTVGNRSRG